MDKEKIKIQMPKLIFIFPRFSKWKVKVIGLFVLFLFSCTRLEHPKKVLLKYEHKYMGLIEFAQNKKLTFIDFEDVNEIPRYQLPDSLLNTNVLTFSINDSMVYFKVYKDGGRADRFYYLLDSSKTLTEHNDNFGKCMKIKSRWYYSIFLRWSTEGKIESLFSE